MMPKMWKTMLLSGCILAVISACGTEPRVQEQSVKKSTVQQQKAAGTRKTSGNIAIGSTPTHGDVTIVQDKNGHTWIPLKEASEALNMHAMWDDQTQTLKMGYTDPIYSLKMGQARAVQGDTPIQLPQAPKKVNGQPYITAESLSQLWNRKVTWDASRKTVTIPIYDETRQLDQGKQQHLSSPAPQAGPGGSTAKIESVGSSAKGRSVVSYGKRFMGVPYKFAAGPYAKTHKFDCSSYIQYVYGHVGIHLPRSSKAQSQVGRRVSVNQLQPGDLLFFYTPGRYASNRIVGHAGIYAGNNQILHTYGDPGVTLSPLNKYWRGRLLYVKRVL